MRTGVNGRQRPAIAASGAKNLPELAVRIPGLNVYHLGAGNPALSQIQMRGYGETGYGRVLLSVDGEHLNSFDTLAAKGGRTDNFAAGEVALNYRPDENAKIFLRWCEFYRNPFTDEYRWRNGVQSETTQPEKGWDVEFGGSWDITDEWFASAVGVFRIGCRYEPTWWKLDGLSLSVSCDNLFDRSYCDYAVASVTNGENAWYPASGRSFMFTVRYEF